MNQEIALTAKSAADTFESLLKIVGKAFPDKPVQIKINTTIPTIKYSIQAPGNEINENEECKSFLGRLRSLPEVDCYSFSLSPESSPQQRNVRAEASFTNQDGIIGTLSFSNPEAFQNIDEFLQALSEQFTIATRKTLLTANLSQDDQAQLKLRQSLLDDLTQALGRLQRHTVDLAEQNSKYVAEITDRLDNKYTEREQLLEERIQKDRDKLDAEKQKHEEKVKEYETRESKYVRRDLLKQMESKIEKQREITLSDKTTHKRWLIHGICWIVFVATATLAGWSAYEIMKSSEFSWHQSIPLSTSVAAFIGNLIYYLKWQNQWFQEHAQAEFRNMRFSADILRASWLAELMFEWEREKERDLPEELITRFSHNLFSDSSINTPEHPIETLAELAKSMKKVRFGKGGFEFERGSE